MEFPYGRAPFFILLAAVLSGMGVFVTHGRFGRARPDLILSTHALRHADVYRRRLPEFEKKHGVRVEIQEVEFNAMQTRLQAAFLAGTAVPDLVEIPENLSFFTRGPLQDIGFLDLTDWVTEHHLEDNMVANRFSAWSTRGHIFALPHDVHPVMLAYRADLVEGLGLDPAQVETWDDFAIMARRIMGPAASGGTPERYALELPSDMRSRFTLELLLAQRGGGLFDEAGSVIFDSEVAADTIVWYVQQLWGPHCIAFDPGVGQPYWRAMMDGLVVFYFAPDWKTRDISLYAPTATGKMKLMPLPAWTKGGRRTSTWGATGLAITKSCRHPELARELAQFLYLDQTDGGQSAVDLHILPPIRSAWQSAAFDRPDPFFSGQRIMKLYASLAPDVPAIWATPYVTKAEAKLGEAQVNAALYYRAHGDSGLHEFVRAELKRNADYIRQLIARNVLLQK